MTNTILAQWQFIATSKSTTLIIPDGCRDFLFRQSCNQRPDWSITSLDSKAYEVAHNKGDLVKGIRLKPGTMIKSGKFLDALLSLKREPDDLIDRVENLTLLAENVSEAMNCLASGLHCVDAAARQLGVSTRTLQRLLREKTGRSPALWMSLARVRKAARLSQGTSRLADIAQICGYADQAHMSRSFKHWFGVSPKQSRSNEHIANGLDQPGYF